MRADTPPTRSRTSFATPTVVGLAVRADAAVHGDCKAAHVVMKAMARRDALLGLDRPTASAAGRPSMIVEPGSDQEYIAGLRAAVATRGGLGKVT